MACADAALRVAAVFSSSQEQATAMAAKQFSYSIGAGSGYVIGAAPLRSKALAAMALHVIGSLCVGTAMLNLARRKRVEA